MSVTETTTRTGAGTGAGLPDQQVEHVDVLIVGAGISGIGAAYHLQTQCPERSFVVLEALGSFGGTWLTHRYPGIRSDSDLYSFGYRFKPWTGAPIATAEEIRRYMGEVIEENHLDRHIRYHHRITGASWSSSDRRWTLTVVDTGTGQEHRFSCGFLWMCQGYYRHAEGYRPSWPGLEDYQGRLVHPQTWPDDLDLHGQRVLVIGSGATAATLVPAIAGEAAHVTVLQRSPTYYRAARNANDLADTLRQLDIDESWIHEIVRRKILHDQAFFTKIAIEHPDLARRELLKGVQELLPEGYDMKHFTPHYRPWQQRLAFVPDGDLFAGIRSGQVTMVTDEIETFNATGVRTRGGEQLDADVVITATANAQLSLSQSTLTFTPADWAPKTVTITAVNDTDVEAITHNGLITHSVASADPLYHNASIATLTVPVWDNDVASVDITHVGGTDTVITEGGVPDSILIKLNTQPPPGTNVTLTLYPPMVFIPPPQIGKSNGYFVNDQGGSNQRDNIVIDYTESILKYRSTFYNTLAALYSPAAIPTTLATAPTADDNIKLQKAHWAASKAVVDQMDLWFNGGSLKARFPVLTEPHAPPPSPAPPVNPRQAVIEAIYAHSGGTDLPATKRYTAEGTYNAKTPPTDTFNTDVRDRVRWCGYLMTVGAPGLISH